MSRNALNATAASLLGFLHDGPMAGWDLYATAQDRIGDFWSLTRSQVYRELATMAADGLVEAGEAGKRDRRPYSLTEKGRVAFAEWCGQEPGEETIRFPLLLLLELGEYVPTELLVSVVRRHRSVHVERLTGYERTRDELGDVMGPYRRATLDFGIAYERAVVGWFDELPPEIRGPGDWPPG